VTLRYDLVGDTIQHKKYCRDRTGTPTPSSSARGNGMRPGLQISTLQWRAHTSKYALASACCPCRSASATWGERLVEVATRKPEPQYIPAPVVGAPANAPSSLQSHTAIPQQTPRWDWRFTVVRFDGMVGEMGMAGAWSRLPRRLATRRKTRGKALGSGHPSCSDDCRE